MGNTVIKHVLIIPAIIIFILSLQVNYVQAQDNTLYLGNRGNDVVKVQQKLSQWGYYDGTVDGIYGYRTAQAVREFQRKNGLAVDGITGTSTWSALGYAAEKKQNVSTLYWNSRGNDVVKVQQKLSQWGYYDGTVDGIYGYRTAQAVREFQGKNGLTVDGVTGSSTWSALGYSAGPQVTSTSTGYNASRSYQDKTYLLAKVISGEARGEPYLGKVAVGAVIMNRVQSAAFPDTIPGVIYQYLAFEAVSNGQYNRVPEKESYLAAQQSIAGWDPTYGCLYYWNPVKSSSQWIWSRNITMRIGEHVFGV